MKNYQLHEKIGQGTFGDVFLAYNREGTHKFAVKVMKRQFQEWNDVLKLKEIKTLSKIKHPHIIQLIQVIHQKKRLYLIFQYAKECLFDKYLKNTLSFPIPQLTIKRYIYELALGLSHLHEKGYFHRDIKPQNILLSAKNHIKIADFGLSKQIRSMPPFTQYVCTRWYRAPQLIISMRNYNAAVDIFALGCLIAELFNMRPLFDGNNQIDQLHLVIKKLGLPAKERWPEFYTWCALKDIEIVGQNADAYRESAQILDNHEQLREAQSLVKRMLGFIPKERITAKEILQNPYFNDIRSEYQSQKYKPKQGVKESKFHQQKRSKEKQMSKERSQLSPNKSNANNIDQLIKIFQQKSKKPKQPIKPSSIRQQNARKEYQISSFKKHQNIRQSLSSVKDQKTKETKETHLSSLTKQILKTPSTSKKKTLLSPSQKSYSLPYLKRKFNRKLLITTKSPNSIQNEYGMIKSKHNNSRETQRQLSQSKLHRRLKANSSKSNKHYFNIVL